MSISIRMLGGFSIVANGVTVIDGDWRPAKAAAIVKILCLQPGRTLHRDQLIDLLWPEADTEGGSSSFYKNLHHLRRALASHAASDLVALHRGAVTLASDATLDIEQFRDLAGRAVAIGDVTLFEQAVSSGDGELLPGDLYETWTEPHRDQLRAVRLAVQLGLGERYLRMRRYDDAVRCFHEAIGTSPVSEDAHTGLMRAYAMNGQRGAALSQYERLRQVTLDELGVEPSPDTAALARQIRNADRLVDAVELATEVPVKAANAAVRRRDWTEATAQYRDAIQRLQAAGGDDEREGELWLSLATVTSANEGTRDIAEYCRRAAALAERCGAHDLLSRALVHFQAASDAQPNNHPGQRESEGLIRKAIEGLPPGPSAARARLLAASARPLAAAARPADERHVTGRTSLAGNADTRIEARLREAVRIARSIDHREALSYALTRLRMYITSPATLDERVAITSELAGMIGRMNVVAEYEAHLMRHEDLLESGDLDGARIEARAVLRIGEEIGAGGIRAAGLSCLATHATADGDLDGAMSLLFESRKADAGYGGNSNSQYRFGIQFLAIRWHQGRIGELYEPYVRAADVAPRQNAPRAALALICAETGRVDDARDHLQHIAGDGVAAIPRDYLWWLTTIGMTQAAIVAGDQSIARDLYALLSPYAERNASTAGAVSFGSAALHVARLAAALGERAAAAQHFESALAFNTRTRQRTWTAHTRHDYATFLSQHAVNEADVAKTWDLRRIADADAREMGIVYGMSPVGG